MAFEDAKDLSEREARADTKGRRDAGKESNPDEKKLKELLPALATALKAKRAAIEAYNKKRKAASKGCGFMSNVVDKAAAEMLSEPEDREMAMRHAEQMELALGIVDKLKK